MRAFPLTVTALAAVLVLTACDNGGGDKNKGKDNNACADGGVSVQIGAASLAPAAGDTGEVPVSITNQSTPCTLEGFPRVDLAAGSASVTVSAQQGAKAQKLKLAKGDSASFTISYVRGKAGDRASLEAKTVKITLPGAKEAQTFPWSYGPVAGKGSADKPNATVSTFQQVGD
ncbi:DUF4232 domain-containing protein [Streptomyces sp. NPDC054794]